MHMETVGEWLTGPELSDLQLRVKQGAAWLAERDALWAEKIVDAVEIGAFEMTCYGNCAVGTVLGDYETEFGTPLRPEHNRNEEAAKLGFMGRSALGSRQMDAEFQALETTWIDYAREQCE